MPGGVRAKRHAFRNLDKGWQETQTQAYGEGTVSLSFRSPINVVECLKSTCFNVLCNGSLVVGTGATEDA